MGSREMKVPIGDESAKQAQFSRVRRMEKSIETISLFAYLTGVVVIKLPVIKALEE